MSKKFYRVKVDNEYMEDFEEVEFPTYLTHYSEYTLSKTDAMRVRDDDYYLFRETLQQYGVYAEFEPVNYIGTAKVLAYTGYGRFKSVP